MGQLVYVSLGSNIEDRYEHLSKAVEAIANRTGKVLKISSIYVTPPWGFEANLDFFNICLLLETTCTPEALLVAFQDIERELGRIRTENQGYNSRPIDIDILTVAEIITNTPNLVIPHPKMSERRFVLEPLREIAPDFIHPISNKSIQQLINACSDNSDITILDQKISTKC